MAKLHEAGSRVITVLPLRAVNQISPTLNIILIIY